MQSYSLASASASGGPALPAPPDHWRIAAARQRELQRSTGASARDSYRSYTSCSPSPEADPAGPQASRPAHQICSRLHTYSHDHILRSGQHFSLKKMCFDNSDVTCREDPPSGLKIDRLRR